MLQLLQNSVISYCLMAIITFCLTQSLKWVCVKPWTNKIQNPRAKKSIHAVIYLFPYALGIGLQFLYAKYIMGCAPDLFAGAKIGFAGHSVYALYEIVYVIITGKSASNKEESLTDEQKAADECVERIISDGKIDEKDHPQLKAFLEKIK